MYLYSHIPKTGGSSLIKMLQQEYVAQNFYQIKSRNYQINRRELLNKTIFSQKDLIIGHNRFGLHKELNTQENVSFDYLTIIRNPIDRIISFYKYSKKQKNHRLYNYINSNKLSLYDFVNEYSLPDMNNGQCYYITNNKDCNSELALNNIKSYYKFIGILERMPLSLFCLQNILNIKFEAILKINTTKSNQYPIDKRTINLIKSKNAEDIALYNSVIKEVFPKQMSQHIDIHLNPLVIPM